MVALSNGRCREILLDMSHLPARRLSETEHDCTVDCCVSPHGYDEHGFLRAYLANVRGNWGSLRVAGDRLLFEVHVGQALRVGGSSCCARILDYDLGPYLRIPRAPLHGQQITFYRVGDHGFIPVPWHACDDSSDQSPLVSGVNREERAIGASSNQKVVSGQRAPG